MLFDHYQAEVLQLIKSTLIDTLSASDLDSLTLETPPEMKMGDFAFPTFKLSKVMKKAPPMIASDLVTKFSSQSVITEKYTVTQAGPYVNFTIKPNILTKEVLSSLLLSRENLGEKTIDRTTAKKECITENIIVEFSSPNVAKAFNIYHLRGTMIGNSICRILRARGFNPIAINHLGDWGTQYGTITLAYMKWGNDIELEKRGISYLVELYVKINSEIEKHPALVDEARALFARLEQGDSHVKMLWEKFIELSLKEFKATYKRLNVTFDHYWGESFYIPMIEALEKEIAEKKLLVESEGAQVVMLDQFGMPPCIIKKGDGSSIYATRDLAAAIYRHQKFNFKKMIYIVGAEQKLHFSQIFKTLELMRYDWAKNCVHVDFGLYRMTDSEGGHAKMSTRKGKFITLEAVLDEAVDGVRKIIDTKHETDMTDDEKKAAAEIIGVGAVIFNDLSTDRNGDVNFDLDRVLDFNGETGPYVQYAHTRCLSILRNAPTDLSQEIDKTKLSDLNFEQKGFNVLFDLASSQLKEPEELDLIRVLARLPLVLDSVLEMNKPSFLANFLIDITKAFNTFYRAHKVLVDDKNLAKARLALVVATQRTLLKSMTLLGMRTPEKM